MAFRGSNFEPGLVPESGSLAGPGSYVGLNTDGEFILTTAGSGGGGGGAVDTYTNSGNNRVITSVSSDTINGEANLTFDGSKLIAVGQISASLGVTGSTVEAQSMTLAGGDGALEFSVAGQNSIKIPDGQGSALIVEEANNAYLTFVTTNTEEKVVFDVDGKLKDDIELLFGNDNDATIEYKSATNQLIISGTHPLGTAISASVDFADSATFQDDAVFNDTVKLVDDKNLIFGTDNDAIIQYSEASTNKLTISGSATGLEIKGNSISVDFPGGTVSSGTLGGNGSYLGLDSNHNLVLATAGGGGTPEGSDTQIQFNNGGSFGASANLTFDDTFLASSRAIFGTTATTLTVAAGELSTLSAMDSGSNKFTTQYDAIGKLQGHVLSLGGSTTVAGQIYYLSSSGGFHAAQANDDDEGGNQLLAIALSTNSTTHGMLRRGTVRITGSLVDDEIEIGSPVYVSKTTAGRYQFATPSGSGEYVRQVGYCLDINTHSPSNQQMDMLLLFEPSDTFIEIA